MFWSGDDGDGNGALIRISQIPTRRESGRLTVAFDRFSLDLRRPAFAWSVTSNSWVCCIALNFHELVGGPLGGHFTINQW